MNVWATQSIQAVQHAYNEAARELSSTQSSYMGLSMRLDQIEKDFRSLMAAIVTDIEVVKNAPTVMALTTEMAMRQVPEAEDAKPEIGPEDVPF